MSRMKKWLSFSVINSLYAQGVISAATLDGGTQQKKGRIPRPRFMLNQRQKRRNARRMRRFRG